MNEADDSGARASGRARWRRLIAPCALFGAAFVLQTVAGFYPARVDALYSRGAYMYIAGALAFVNKFYAYSLAEALTLLLAACLAGWLAWQGRRLYLRRVRVGALLFSSLLRALWLAGAGLWVFLLIWGLNYQRAPLSATLGMERREATAEELETISRAIVEGVNRSYEETHAGAGEDGASRLTLTRAQLYAELSDAYRRVTLTGVGGEVDFGPPKPVYFSGLMSRMQVSGIYSPLTGEPNFNAQMPDADLPFTIAHEIAHQRGFAREDEASFVAFVACTASPHPYVRYSAYLNALGVLNIHARVAPERAREIFASLAQGPRADMRARVLFWRRHQGSLGRMTQSLNNAYLKANRVKSGVRNYNEVNRLIIGYYLLLKTREAGQTTTPNAHRED
ncbi:MAG TPA: DUF3810 domain-containing protein [Pyrinomonadaceae bacterium]|jgi:hypothetical protein|nr:DUF3810 domain-containing protein [Pyrinomonadaceae bacterium]